jgi:fatty acid desaturase
MRTYQSTQQSPLNVQWRDLVQMTPSEKAWELSLSVPWLVGSLCAYHFGYIAIGAACSFYFFLTGLRQSHGAQHYSLGMPKRFQDGVLFGLSAFMLASMHAVQASHLHHHRHCLEDDDAEGSTARLSWWQAVLSGPAFVWRLHVTAWHLATGPKRHWIIAELLVIAVVLAWAFVFPNLHTLRWHVSAMVVGECLTGFFAVWTVHHGCDSHSTMARTQRGRWVNRLCYSMFYHAEHHLFPLVPTCHLGALAQRIDSATSAFAERQVIQFTRDQPPNHALQRTRRGRRGGSRRLPCAGSLSLGR